MSGVRKPYQNEQGSFEEVENGTKKKKQTESNQSVGYSRS